MICSRSPPLFLQSLAQVRRRSWAPNCSIPICLADCSTTDQTAQSLRLSPIIFPPFEIDRSSRPSSMPAAVIQALIPCLTQIGDGHGADASSLPFKVGQHPPPLALLDGLDVELGQLLPAQGAADQQRQDHVIAFALQGRAVGNGQQLFGLLPGQPVSQPGSLLADVRDVREARRLLDPDHAVAPRLADQLPDRGEPDVDRGGRQGLHRRPVLHK